MLTLLKIQDHMSNALRGETTVSPQAVKDFAEECTEAAERQLVRQRGEFRIRMSGLGRPSLPAGAGEEGHQGRHGVQHPVPIYVW